MQFKILIVEDNADTRELLHFYFTNAGFTVVTAVDGAEGIYMATAEQPDCILSDLSMPKMTGIDMIRTLRSQPETASLPIIVITAHGNETTEEAIQAGANQAFYKPFDFDTLVEVVENLLDEPDEP
jgi:CheY-like chemotaxis protein